MITHINSSSECHGCKTHTRLHPYWFYVPPYIWDVIKSETLIYLCLLCHVWKEDWSRMSVLSWQEWFVGPFTAPQHFITLGCRLQLRPTSRAARQSFSCCQDVKRKKVGSNTKGIKEGSGLTANKNKRDNLRSLPRKVTAKIIIENVNKKIVGEGKLF